MLVHRAESNDMKTTEQVDHIMAGIPPAWRDRWCGGENGTCACLGCVYTGSKAVVAGKIAGTPYRGDPEGISEDALRRNHPNEHAKYMLTRDEWTAWQARQATT
jgi:hypothetical protein